MSKPLGWRGKKEYTPYTRDPSQPIQYDLVCYSDEEVLATDDLSVGTMHVLLEEPVYKNFPDILISPPKVAPTPSYNDWSPSQWAELWHPSSPSSTKNQEEETSEVLIETTFNLN